MKFSLIRIDDRLIHGQVVVGWTRSKGINVIVAVDDIVANDAFQCSLLKFAVPPGVKEYILTSNKAAALFESEKLNGKNVMLLVKSPKTLLDLIALGVDISDVNVGNVRPKDSNIEILPYAYTNEDNISTWKSLAEKSKLTGQLLPDSPKSNVNDILIKH